MQVVIKHAIATGLVLILCTVFFLQTLNYPVSAARLPQILIIIIAALAITMLIEAFVKQKKETASEKAEKAGQAEQAEKMNVKRVVVFGLLIALYIALMEVVGYFIITPLFTFIALMYLKATKVIIAIILSIGFTAFIYGLFNMFLNVPVPMGIFF